MLAIAAIIAFAANYLLDRDPELRTALGLICRGPTLFCESAQAPPPSARRLSAAREDARP